MNHCRRLKVILPVLVLLTLLGSSRPASAQIPVTDVAHIAVTTYEGVLRYAQAAYSIAQRLQALYNQYQQIEYQLRALKKLDFHSWRDVGPLYNQLNSILVQAGSLTYAMQDLEDQFYSAFPGAIRYTNFPLEEFTRFTKILDTYRLNLLSLHQLHEDQAGSLQVLGIIQKQVDSAEGHEQVLEAQAALQSWQASQLATIGSTLESLANVQTVASSYAVNKDAMETQTALDLYEATLNRAVSDHGDDHQTFTVLPPWMPVR